MASKLINPVRYRWAVLSRIVAAIVGGYALASACTACLAIGLPGRRADAVLTATLLSFSVYAGAVMWAFAARNATRAWLGLVLPSGLLALAAGWFRSAPGP